MRKQSIFRPNTMRWLSILALAAILLAGCLQTGTGRVDQAVVVKETIAALSTQYTPQPPPATATFTATPQPSITRKPSSSPTTTEEVCTQNRGQIELREIVIPISKYPLAFRVYLPPCYEESSEIDYPVLYLLHGQSYKDDQWDRLGAG